MVAQFPSPYPTCERRARVSSLRQESQRWDRVAGQNWPRAEPFVNSPVEFPKNIFLAGENCGGLAVWLAIMVEC
jgi:hypothetical protein